VTFHAYSWNELDVDTLYEMLRLRSDVFVVEQNCVFLDLDNVDQKSLHVVGKHQDRIVACARVFVPEETDGKSDICAHIGRVVTVADFRSKGVGRQLMLNAIDYCKSKWPQMTIEIGAQSHLDNFYGKGTAEKPGLGFVRTSEEYLEDGIPHVTMQLGCLSKND